MVGLLQAPRGTRLYERLQREGRLLGETSGDNVSFTTNIIPAMSMETLREGYQRLLRSIYAPKPFYQRLKNFLREYHPPKVRASLRFQYKMALLRSILRLGILGRERIHYWKMLLWTLVNRPNLLPTAVTLAIYGYHFRKVCERHIFR